MHQCRLPVSQCSEQIAHNNFNEQRFCKHCHDFKCNWTRQTSLQMEIYWCPTHLQVRLSLAFWQAELKSSCFFIFSSRPVASEPCFWRYLLALSITKPPHASETEISPHSSRVNNQKQFQEDNHSSFDSFYNRFKIKRKRSSVSCRHCLTE